MPFVLVSAPGRGADRLRGAGGGAARGRRGARSDEPPRRYRIEVMHGVNLDQLGRRDPLLYGTLTLAELERRIEHEARELGLETRFFQTNHEGAFVERLHALRRAGRRDPLEPRLLDALRLGDPRRPGDRRAAGARDPPLRRPGARAVAAGLGDRRPLLRDDLRARARRLRRCARAAARGARAGRAREQCRRRRCHERAGRLAAELREREVDVLLVGTP